MLLCVYITLSCILLFNGDPYHQSIYLTSANLVSSSVYRTSNNVTSYFNLKDANEDLNRQNALLQKELLAAQTRLQQLEDIRLAQNTPVDSSLARYDFIVAHVINNSINRANNYLTISKGSLDGIKPDMGVIDQNGIIGKVNVVGPHTSRVISLLNDNLKISCKVKGALQIGSLVWDGNDYREALLKELPRHSSFAVGDTVVTSGYSTSFPEGVPVGVIAQELKDYDENFYTLKIRLFTDFSQLSTVRVVVDYLSDELNEIETDEQPEDKLKLKK